MNLKHTYHQTLNTIPKIDKKCFEKNKRSEVCRISSFSEGQELDPKNTKIFRGVLLLLDIQRYLGLVMPEPSSQRQNA